MRRAAWLICLVCLVCLVKPPLRVFNEGLPGPRVARAQEINSLHPLLCSNHLLRGAAEAALYCAHRTSTVSSCAFCEQ